MHTMVMTAEDGLVWTDWLGLLVWLVGFFFEAVGDYQLSVHIKKKDPSKKKLIDWGLWRYTRHPNYFGEAVMWWGIWLIACSVPKGWITFFAPLVAHLGLRYG
jgi:steroid 5-alpha reductase family enzyme